MHEEKTHTILIPLSRSLSATVDEVDSDLASHKWYAHVNHVRTMHYAARHVLGQRIYMHRVIMSAAPGQIVDHINGDGLDNRRSNLRIVSHAENMRNSDRVRSGGASFDPRTGRWFSRVQWGGRRIMLGRLASREEALQRAKRARELLLSGATHDDVLFLVGTNSGTDITVSGIEEAKEA